MSINWRHYYYRYNWNAFWSILRALNRRAELKQLIQWADRKALRGPARAYRKRLEHEEDWLMRYKIRYPNLARWSLVLFRVGRLIKPAPRYFAKGSAAAYKSKTL